MADEERMLGEHESHKNFEKHADAPDQSPKDKKLVKKIEKLFHERKQYRQKYDHKWMDFYKMYRGLQWKEERPPYRHSEVINMVFAAINSVIPIMTDTRPKFEYLPNDPTDVKFAELVNMMAEYDWSRNNWSEKLAEVLYESHFFGTGFSSMKFNPELDNGLGAIEFDSEDTFHFYPTPKVKSIQKDRAFIKAYPLRVEEIKRRWPKMGKYVRPDISSEEFDRTDLDKIRLVSPTDIAQTYEAEKPHMMDGGSEALIIECLLRDDEEIESEEKEKVEIKETEAGLARQEISKSYSHKKKFPSGRLVIICNKLVLYDGPNQYEDGLWPYAKCSNYLLPHEFWGVSEVEQLEGPQRTFNKIVSFALDVMTMMGNPIIVMDTDTGIDPDMLYNEPGMVVEKNPGSEFRRESGVQLQPYVLQVLDRLKVWFDSVSGASDVTRGVSPSANASGFAIDQLQEAAQTRIRQKSRNLDVMLQDCGQMYLNRMLQFYEAPRIIRITNDEQATQFFKVEIGKDETGQKFAKVQNFIENQDGELVPDFENAQEFPINGDLDVRVVTGSLLPFNKTVKENRLLNLFDRQIVDREEVLKGIDHPNWEAVLQRLQEKEAQMQQQAQQAQQMQ